MHRTACFAPPLRRDELSWNPAGAHTCNNDPIDIVCATCGQIFFEHVTVYDFRVASQPHITYEIHLDTPCPTNGLKPGGSELGLEPHKRVRAFQCVNGCSPNYWSVDGGTGCIDMKSRAFAVACGPGLAATRKSHK